jgi:hypothetical protein
MTLASNKQQHKEKYRKKRLERKYKTDAQKRKVKQRETNCREKMGE